MKIEVKYKPNEQPITVYGGWFDKSGFLIDWCTHAGAEEVPDNGVQVRYNYEKSDLEVNDVVSWLKVCDKCNAYFDPIYGSWED